jgi:SAM-dependent methyltransferase
VRPFRAVDAQATCPACGGSALSLAVDTGRMLDLAARARAFHIARLRSHPQEELDERASFTQGEAAALLRCNDCTHLLRWPRPDPGSTVLAYAEDRYPDDRLAEMIASQVSLYRRKVPVLRRLLATRAPRIVEVGSFVGGFLEVARTVGWDAVGVDPNAQLAESCRSRGLRIVEGTLEGLATCEAQARYDALTIWNTFDQLADPQPILSIAAKILRPGGILALRVPHGIAFEALHARFERARGPTRRFLEACLAWNNLLSFPYLHGYGLASLDALVPSHGFRRVLRRGDVLGILAGRATRGFARNEERGVKSIQLAWIRLQARDPASPLSVAPWLDVYYRRDADRVERDTQDR